MTLVVAHPRKDYVLNLDGNGEVLVSETIWKRLQEAGAGFDLLNAVKRPPKQTVSMSAAGFAADAMVAREISDALVQIAPPGVSCKFSNLRVTPHLARSSPNG